MFRDRERKDEPSHFLDFLTEAEAKKRPPYLSDHKAVMTKTKLPSGEQIKAVSFNMLDPNFPSGYGINDLPKAQEKRKTELLKHLANIKESENPDIINLQEVWFEPPAKPSAGKKTLTSEERRHYITGLLRDTFPESEGWEIVFSSNDCGVSIVNTNKLKLQSSSSRDFNKEGYGPPNFAMQLMLQTKKGQEIEMHNAHLPFITETFPGDPGFCEKFIEDVLKPKKEKEEKKGEFEPVVMIEGDHNATLHCKVTNVVHSDYRDGKCQGVDAVDGGFVRVGDKIEHLEVVRLDDYGRRNEARFMDLEKMKPFTKAQLDELKRPRIQPCVTTEDKQFITNLFSGDMLQQLCASGMIVRPTTNLMIPPEKGFAISFPGKQPELLHKVMAAFLHKNGLDIHSDSHGNLFIPNNPKAIKLVNDAFKNYLALNPPANFKDNESKYLEAFNKIYLASFEARPFNSQVRERENFLQKLDGKPPAEQFKLIQSEILSNPKGRVAMAMSEAFTHWQNCNSTNLELVQSLYRFASNESFVSRSYVGGGRGLTWGQTAATYATSITQEEVKQRAGKTGGKLAKIASCLDGKMTFTPSGKQESKQQRSSI